ncbi:MAG: hypothetical protein U0350_36040 [Caldilineaceae bacterium]
MDNPMSPFLHFPTLSAPYDQALRAAIAYILERYDPLGIIASGSIIRGNPGPSSDFDIFVIRADNQRQRVQKRFAGVPAEIFTNNPAAVRHYFAEERKDGTPITAHMLATGIVVLNRDPVVDELCNEAISWLAQRPDLSPAALTWLRYMTADQYDNAKDIQHTAPAMAALLLHQAVSEMVRYTYLAANRNVPRVKEMIDTLESLNPQLKQLVEGYFLATDNEQRFALADQIAAQTLGVDGFFEWETEPAVFP